MAAADDGVMTSTANARKKVVDNMTPELRAYYEKLQNVLYRHAKATISGKYAAGEVIRDVLADTNVIEATPEPVEQLAAGLGMTATQFYECHDVVKTFPKKELFELIEAEGNKDIPRITWSHLLELKRIASESDRQKCAHFLLNNSKRLSVSDLRDHVATTYLKKKKHGTRAGRPLSRPTTPQAGLKQIAASCRQLAKLETDIWDDYVFEPLSKVSDSQVDDNLIQLVTDAAAQLLVLKKGVEEDIEKIEKISARLTKLKDSKDKQRQKEDEEEARPPVTRWGGREVGGKKAKGDAAKGSNKTKKRKKAKATA